MINTVNLLATDDVVEVLATVLDVLVVVIGLLQSVLNDDSSPTPHVRGTILAP